MPDSLACHSGRFVFVHGAVFGSHFFPADERDRPRPIVRLLRYAIISQKDQSINGMRFDFRAFAAEGAMMLLLLLVLLLLLEKSHGSLPALHLP